MYDGERDTEVSKMILEHSILGHPVCRYHPNLWCLCQGPYVGGNRHGAGQLVKSDGEERTENYKEGKLVNFTVTKSAE